MTPSRPVAWAALLVAAVPAAAEQPADPPRPCVVVRVTRGFVESLTRGGFEQVRPVATTTDKGATVAGSARVAANYSVVFHKNPTETAFEVRVDGRIDTDLGVTRRSVRVCLDGSAPFTAVRRISADGDDYAGGPVSVAACYSSELAGVATSRRGALAPVVRRVAGRVALRELPGADRAATDRIRDEVRDGVIRDTEEVIATLNTIRDVRQAVTDLLRTSGLAIGKGRPALATTDDALLAGVGFPAGEPPTLPDVAGPPAPVEVWVKYQPTPEQERAVKLARAAANAVWDTKVKPELVKRLDRHSPALARRVKEATHDVDDVVPGAPGWYRVRFFKELHEAARTGGANAELSPPVG